VAKNSSADQKNDDNVRRYIPAQFDKSSSGKDRGGEEKRKDELRKCETEGFEKGYAEGLASGIKEGQKEISERLGRLESVIRELDGVKERKIEELLPEIVDLSLDIARKIIHRKIEQDREIIVSVVREAIHRLGREEKMLIRVNPADYDTMISNIDVLREETRLKDVTVEPSASVSPGGCTIETPSGEVDARIEEQIKEIGDAITTALDS
jgi:flagellar assembly protein FliH